MPLYVLIISLHELHPCNKYDMVDIRSNMQIYDLNSKPHGINVSEILLTSWLDSASILHQGQNITKLFTSTGFMNPLIIKTHLMILGSSIITTIHQKRVVWDRNAATSRRCYRVVSNLTRQLSGSNCTPSRQQTPYHTFHEWSLSIIENDHTSTATCRRHSGDGGWRKICWIRQGIR